MTTARSTLPDALVQRLAHAVAENRVGEARYQVRSALDALVAEARARDVGAAGLLAALREAYRGRGEPTPRADNWEQRYHAVVGYCLRDYFRRGS